MSVVLIDSNILLDIITSDSQWADWSEARLREADERGSAVIDPLIYAEVAPAFDRETDLIDWFAGQVIRRTELPYEAAWPASQAFSKYRASGGTRTSPLPDFYIGAHAEVAGLTLLTRDPSRYRTYFPSVRLITP